MDNNSYNFEFEPMEQNGQQEQEQTNRTYSYSPYQEPRKPKKEKKDRTTGKIVALVAVVALVAGMGGTLLTAAIAGLRYKEDTQITEVVEQPAGEDAYTLEKHSLPEKLSSNDTGKSLSAAQVYELTVNSVVGIQTEARTNVFGQEAVSASAGSGFILSEDGYIITNAHVVSGATKITVDLFNGDSYDAQLVGSDANFDIAVLKIEAEDLPAVSVGNSDTLRVGEEVVAIGNPLGELTFTMTNGILSALDREINTDGNPQNMLQTNAAINSGNSGGPLFDMDGNVIGVTTAKYSGSTTSGTTIEGLGFAIPINEALKVAYDLAEHGYVKDQAYLGVTVATLDNQTATYYGLPIGPRVESVNPGSCAEKAGLQVGDIIIAYNGTKVENNPALLAQLRKSKAGDTVELTVFRAGAEIKMSVVLDERPSEEVINAQAQTQEQEQQQQQQQQQPEAQQPQQVQPDPYSGFYYQFPFGFDFFG